MRKNQNMVVIFRIALFRPSKVVVLEAIVARPTPSSSLLLLCGRTSHPHLKLYLQLWSSVLLASNVLLFSATTIIVELFTISKLLTIIGEIIIYNSLSL